ncbi:hypothetical protein ACLOJK_029730 [Asimina triloba]
MVASLRSRYRILDSIELSAPREGEILRDHRNDSICLNEWMFKARVRILFEFGTSEHLHLRFGSPPILGELSNRADRHLWASLLLKKVMLGCVTFAMKQNTKIFSNLPDSVSEWKLRFFYACFKETQGATSSWDIPFKWNDELSEVNSIAQDELEWGQSTFLKFFQSHNLKWHPTNEAFFRWCQVIIPFFGALTASIREEAEERRCGKALGSSADARFLTRGVACVGLSSSRSSNASRGVREFPPLPDLYR